MMSIFKRVAALGVAAAMAACGGGGSGAGTSPFGSGSGSSGGSGGGGSTPAAYIITVDVQRAGAATTQVGTSETVQAVAVVRASSGAVVEGAVVTFGETGPSLITLAPVSGTALTNASGSASVDLTGASASSTGATTVTASVTIAGTRRVVEVVEGVHQADGEDADHDAGDAPREPRPVPRDQREVDRPGNFPVRTGGSAGFEQCGEGF